MVDGFAEVEKHGSGEGEEGGGRASGVVEEFGADEVDEDDRAGRDKDEGETAGPFGEAEDGVGEGEEPGDEGWVVHVVAHGLGTVGD